MSQGASSLWQYFTLDHRHCDGTWAEVEAGIEHDRMRGLLDQMATTMAVGDLQELLDEGDTLLLLIQQHNQKEEQMLYPMSEQALAAGWAELHDRLEASRREV